MQNVPHLEFKQKKGYWALLALATVIFLIALGPGFFKLMEMDAWWSVKFFEFLCHQQAERSYTFNGLPMAVCARCIGIYGSFLIGIIGMPIIARWANQTKRQAITLIIVSIALNLIDILGNAFSLWQNSLHSRLLLGAFFGCTLAIILADEFFKPTINKEYTYE